MLTAGKMRRPAVADGGCNNDRTTRNLREGPGSDNRKRTRHAGASDGIRRDLIGSSPAGWPAPTEPPAACEVSGESSANASASARGERLGRVLQRLRDRCRAPGPRPGRAGRGPEHARPAANRRPARSRPAACRRASASSSASSGSGMTQRRCSLAPTSVQYAAATWVSRADGQAAALACSSASSSPGVDSSTSSTQKPKPSWTVTCRVSPMTRSCRRGPWTRRVDQPHHRPARRPEPPTARRPGPGRVAEVVLDLQAQPDLPGVSDQRGCGRRAATCTAGRLRSEPASVERSRRGGHQLTHRDDVALRRQPGERTADVGVAAPPGARGRP